MNDQNYTYFFCQIGKKCIFLVCHRTLIISYLGHEKRKVENYWSRVFLRLYPISGCGSSRGPQTRRILGPFAAGTQSHTATQSLGRALRGGGRKGSRWERSSTFHGQCYWYLNTSLVLQCPSLLTGRLSDLFMWFEWPHLLNWHILHRPREATVIT